MTWDYSNTAKVIYQDGSMIIVRRIQQDNTYCRVCQWWRIELANDVSPLSAYLDQLGLTLVPRWQSWPEQLELI